MKLLNVLCLILLFLPTISYSIDYNVGPGQSLTNIGDVPWNTLQAGDRVYIHWKNTPYYEKWVINVQGTAANPIEIIGVSGTNGEKPIIDGDGAVTPTYLDYWNEVRGIIKIGGSSNPVDNLPSYISIENLEIRSARPAYQFTSDNGQTETYSDNAAAIYIEKGEHITIKNCDLHDAGNGLFIGTPSGVTQNILITGNYIYDNGIVGSIYEHNAYTSAIGIIYEFNRFGPLRTGALGNNLKDRSAGLVVRYNWIESGNRQLDLVDADGIPEVVNHPSYESTYVYGNILIEPDGAGNSQIVHYGGDNGNQADYRKGNLFFYNNTVISTRSGNTTLVRLSSQDETMEAFNNVIYVSANGTSLAMMNDDGTLNLSSNWMNTGWVDSHSAPMSGTINDQGNNLNGTDPLFSDFAAQDFTLQIASPLIDNGMDIPAIHLPNHNVAKEYVKHTDSINKLQFGDFDIGAFENIDNLNSGENDISGIQLYPNPATSKITIQNSNEKHINLIQLYSISGKLILETLNSEIDISHINTGVYLVKVFSDNSINVLRFEKK
jgi:hypothetical protein